MIKETLINNKKVLKPAWYVFTILWFNWMIYLFLIWRTEIALYLLASFWLSRFRMYTYETRYFDKVIGC